MADEIKKVGITSGAGREVKATKVSAKFIRVRSSGAAVFEVNYSDNSKKTKESSRDEMLGALKKILETPSLLNNQHMFINGNNFSQIVGAYQKTGHLGDELTQLFTQKKEELRSRLRELAAPPEVKKLNENPGGTLIGIGVTLATKIDTPTKVSVLETLDYSSMKPEDAEREVKAIFTNNSEGYDKFKAFNDLLPNIRYALNQPNLTLAEVKQFYNNTKGTSQQAYNRLREALQRAVSNNLKSPKASVDPLVTFFKGEQGQELLRKPGEIFTMTIAHLFAQSRKENVSPEHITNSVKIYLATAKALATKIREAKS
jgi:hypothetical protein